MITIQKAVIAWAKMCETDLDRVTRITIARILEHVPDELALYKRRIIVTSVIAI